ncbi:protein-glutamate methylesterase/protein-glutamine glutaminase [Colwellia psychrerythraea]|uniref:Protein-glutamate methylesterase/protein-glutamine glutaminase n=1 Tax=Colwellia psychrerythraea TaxID=28229 RepID=A0A099KMT5_COLPS|nr:chemotaxis response regulator protein-glutamate methylesterase [Colwellia psychrerythraea]KGJ91786.1 response regulator receiver modulated CheB methylesterase [Colwellia psychrerythraea]
MIVDDSAVVRQVISQILNDSTDIEVYAVANDPIFAYRKMQKQWPEVIVLDIEMPRMDGISFLKKIMSERPTPVVICSSLAEKGAELSLNALAAGAVDIITKPQIGLKNFLEEAASNIKTVVRAAAKARLQKTLASRVTIETARPSSEINNINTKSIINSVLSHTNLAEKNDLVSMSHTTDRVIAIGSSTGGTIALEKVLTALPATCPGIVIVQHMPEKFTKAFADRLNSLCELEVLEASSGDRIIPGRALIAPGGRHLQVKRSGAQYITIVSEGPAVNRHCPSVDVLFNSLASSAKQNATGIILTGMGSDGAQGLLKMKNVGSKTMAQNESSSVVFGMPKEAIKLGAAQKIVDLSEIADLIKH